MAAAIPEPGVRDLMQRAACLPYGLSLIEFGMPPCVSEMLGVSAELVLRARAALADPGTRPALAGEYAHTVSRREEDPEAFCRRCAEEGRVPTPGCPLALVREAEARPEGLETLRSTALEVAATSFRVHPFVILGRANGSPAGRQPDPRRTVPRAPPRSVVEREKVTRTFSGQTSITGKCLLFSVWRAA